MLHPLFHRMCLSNLNHFNWMSLGSVYARCILCFIACASQTRSRFFWRFDTSMLHPLFHRMCLSNWAGYDSMQMMKDCCILCFSASASETALVSTLTISDIMLHPLFQRKCLWDTTISELGSYNLKLHPLFQRKCLWNFHNSENWSLLGR